MLTSVYMIVFNVTAPETTCQAGEHNWSFLVCFSSFRLRKFYNKYMFLHVPIFCFVVFKSTKICGLWIAVDLLYSSLIDFNIFNRYIYIYI